MDRDSDSSPNYHTRVDMFKELAATSSDLAVAPGDMGILTILLDGTHCAITTDKLPLDRPDMPKEYDGSQTGKIWTCKPDDHTTIKQVYYSFKHPNSHLPHLNVQVAIGGNLHVWWVSPKAFPATVVDSVHMLSYIDERQTMTHIQHLTHHLRLEDMAHLKGDTKAIDGILCDSGYVSSSLKEYGVVAIQKKFPHEELSASVSLANDRCQQNRNEIEHHFGHLKTKFAVLHDKYHLSVELFIAVFRVCAALYNLDLDSKLLSEEERTTFEFSPLLDPHRIAVSGIRDLLIVSDYEIHKDQVKMFDTFDDSKKHDLLELYQIEAQDTDQTLKKVAIGDASDDLDYHPNPTKRQRKKTDEPTDKKPTKRTKK